MRNAQNDMLNTLKSMDKKQDKHVQITKEGFESVTRELKDFKEIHEEIKELRHEVDDLKGTVARIEKKVTIL
ncbi:hypothetical protein IPdc08_00800 [archaeon]|nr:hypothetical protein IPdc08_00800 [archaeon]